MTITRTSLLLGATVLLAAAVDAGAQQRTAGSGIRISKDAERTAAYTTTTTTTTSQATVVSPGVVTLSTSFTVAPYANMNEKNMTAHMAAGDSLEIEISQLAQQKAMDPRVRDYATMLVNDHNAHLAKTIEIITDEHVGVEPLAVDPEVARMREILTQLRNQGGGTDWDAAFVRFQLSHHNNELSLWTPTVIKNAHDDDLEEHIEATLKSLTKHRDGAVVLAQSLSLL
jgi:putative membrane protein